MLTTGKNFKEAFIYFISRRVFEDIADAYLSNSKYIQLGLDIGACSEEIMSIVPEERQEELNELFYKYTITCRLREALVNEILYTEGLKDGIHLGCILEIGKEVFEV